jgi:hypothetical protein
MAYSDYGGYAYRNGQRVAERSDATISPDGDVFGSPGMWPGFAAYAAGGKEEYEKRREWPSGHVVLGDGPIYVVLYKQSYVSIHRGPDGLDELVLLKDMTPDAVATWTDKEGKTHRWLNTDYFRNSETHCAFEVDGWLLEVFFREEDNHYQYAKLTQPDGNLWHGWSGYGVGAGLEDAGYGYSTEDREDVIRSLWPESIAA